MHFPFPAKDPVPTLPQNASPEEQDARKKALKGKQKDYKLTNDLPLPLQVGSDATMTPGIPLLKTPLPPYEAFTEKYTVGRGVDSIGFVQNEALATKMGGMLFESFKNLAELEEQYVKLGIPEVSKNWTSDEIFAEQRLSGVNPGVIQRLSINNLPPDLDAKALLKTLGLNLLDEVATRKIYFVDHISILKDVETGEIIAPNPRVVVNPNLPATILFKKYLPKTIGIFEWDDDAVPNDPVGKPGRLKPIAIQIDTGDGKYKIVTPNPDDAEDLDWLLAKMCFSVADANVHEMHVHLGIHHFAQEAFGAVTPRQLAENHPVNILLKPHLRFMVWNNQQGLEKLIQPSGPVNLLLAGTLKDSITLAVNATKSWSVKDTFPADIKKRGMDDTDALPHYPFRDDAQLIWEAIEQYVTEYLSVFYKETKDITKDYELQNWAAELASTDVTGGNYKDMPEKITGIEELIELLSVIIYTASAGHSAVNYPQYPYIGFSSNMPLSGYANYQEYFTNPPKTEVEKLGFITRFLPPKFCALAQITITNALSVYHYDQIGDFENPVDSPEVNQARYRFDQNLAKITARIQRRNKVRLVPYEYLIPEEVLNSASI